MPTVHRTLCTLNCLSTLCLSAALGIVHCVCMCVHYALCTVHVERVELSEQFMSICTVHCASNSVHCSMLYTFCTLNGLNCLSTLCLSALTLCSVQCTLSVCTHSERVELLEQFMSICRGLDVSPTLLRLPPPIFVLLSLYTLHFLPIL